MEQTQMKFLKWFDGKKTILASLYWGAVMPSLAVWFPEGVPGDVNRWVVTVGFVLSAVGLGHKWYKKTEEKQ
jgi:hypothetical protein